MKQFATESKRYGIVYCALRGKTKSEDGLVDVMVRAEDASKINRIVERFKFSTVDSASIKSEVEKSIAKKNSEKPVPEKDVPDKGGDTLLDDLLAKPIQKDKNEPDNPAAEKTDFFTKTTAKSIPSESILNNPTKTTEGLSKADRPSVREELKEIKETQDKKKVIEPTLDIDKTANKSTEKSTIKHIQPSRKKNRKKNKER